MQNKLHTNYILVDEHPYVLFLIYQMLLIVRSVGVHIIDMKKSCSMVPTLH